MKIPFLFDSHCHVQLMADKQKQNNIIGQMISNNIVAVCVGTTLEDSIQAIEFSRENPNLFFPSIGIHPCSVEEVFEQQDYIFNQMENMIKNNKIYAIGETGIDLFHKKDNLEKQIIFFKKHIELAIKYELPLIIHVRDSDDIVLDILKIYNYDKFLIHCFSGNLSHAKAYLKLNCFLSFAGKITYKKDEYLLDIIKQIPLDKIFVETDAPWLSPEPFRKYPNDPNKIIYIYEKIAKIKKLDFELMSQKIVKNSLTFFKIKFWK